MISSIDLSSKNIMIISSRSSKKSSSIIGTLIKVLDETANCYGVDYDEPSSKMEELLLNESVSIDLIIIVAPVYNASYPGNLKNLLDFVPRHLLKDIPVTSVLHAGGARFGMTWSTMYYPWLSTIGMDVIDDYIYLDNDDAEVFSDYELLVERPTFLYNVVDPFLQGISSKVNK